MPLVASDAAAHRPRAAIDVVPNVVPVRPESDGATATGLSESTERRTNALLVRVPSLARMTTEYVPDGVFEGTVIDTEVTRSLPVSAASARCAVSGASGVATSETSPSKSSARKRRVATDTVRPPAFVQPETLPASTLKPPAATSRATSSRRSGWPSGSVDVFQSSVDAAMSAAFAWAGVRPGRDESHSAAAPVTCGAAIDVPDE